MSKTPAKYRMDMCEGPLLSKIVVFSLPLFGSMLLQLMFNAADIIVIGRYAAHEAMAAVGSTSSLTYLIINVFIGLSIGTNVLAANFFGAKDIKQLRQLTHTSMFVAVFGGIAMSVVGGMITYPLLKLMQTPDNVIDKSALYMWMYFIGMPFIMINNFGSALLRAIGDTKRPLYFLFVAGVINVILNLFFVIQWHMDVDGVALATTISQGISGALIWRTLVKSDDLCRLRWRKLHIHQKILKKMMAIGIPAGLQGSCFALSNVLIQTSVNSFGSLAMAGNSVAMCLEGIIYTGSCCYNQTVISFVGQNEGGGFRDRTKKSIYYCLILAMSITTVMGCAFYASGRTLCGFFNPDSNVVDWALKRMKYSFTTYGLCGIMDVLSGSLRGLGHSTMAATITLVSVCGVRLLWIFVVFPLHRTLDFLIVSYPVSWALTAAACCICIVKVLAYKRNCILDK